jgi:hypothetical protein
MGKIKKGKTKDLDVIMMEIKDAIDNSAKKSIRLRCKTLLTRFGFLAKTKERSQFLMNKFDKFKILTTPSLFECKRDDWITLSVTEPPVPVSSPIEENFDEENNFAKILDEISTKELDTEKGVEIRFILPLLELLGYKEEDRADGYPVNIYEGVRKIVKEADFVLFNGSNRAKDNALLVIEAKSVGKKLERHINQARSYAIWLGTPYYLVTNGDEIKVYLFRGAIWSDIEVFKSKRLNLKNIFKDLYQFISKEKIIEYKKQKNQMHP